MMRILASVRKHARIQIGQRHQFWFALLTAPATLGSRSTWKNKTTQNHKQTILLSVLSIYFAYSAYALHTQRIMRVSRVSLAYVYPEYLHRSLSPSQLHEAVNVLAP